MVLADDNMVVDKANNQAPPKLTKEEKARSKVDIKVAKKAAKNEKKVEKRKLEAVDEEGNLVNKDATKGVDPDVYAEYHRQKSAMKLQEYQKKKEAKVTKKYGKDETPEEEDGDETMEKDLKDLKESEQKLSIDPSLMEVYKKQKYAWKLEKKQQKADEKVEKKRMKYDEKAEKKTEKKKEKAEKEEGEEDINIGEKEKLKYDMKAEKYKAKKEQKMEEKNSKYEQKLEKKVAKAQEGNMEVGEK